MAEWLERILQRQVQGRVPEYALVQKPNRCQDLIGTSGGSTTRSVPTRASENSRLFSSSRAYQQQPWKPRLRSNHWLEESRQVIGVTAFGLGHGSSLGTARLGLGFSCIRSSL